MSSLSQGKLHLILLTDMPPKDKKRPIETDIDHDHVGLHDHNGAMSASNSDSLRDVIRQELHELKSGIQDKLDLVIHNQESL